MTNDIISSMITAIRNAVLNNTKIVDTRATNTTRSIAKILLQEGFISGFREREENGRSLLSITLPYKNAKNPKKNLSTNLRRISKPGLRVYTNYKDIPKVLGGIGIVILSTSQGIMIDREARQQKIGGEILCYIS
jgi:small subunit ribosomal protein S8